MSDPFLIDGPAVISFSGGRTSGYMLRRILDAGLQPDVHVLFANTGREMPQTLRFVYEVQTRWDVDIHWLQYGHYGGEYPWIEEVTYLTAARHGEPFEAFITKRGLPNPVFRTCTQELKIRPMRDWMRGRGYEHWTNVVGIRADEPRRVAKMKGRETRERWEIVLPLADAGITEADVMAFWSAQDFDLELRRDQGNCDLCMLKSFDKLKNLVRERPDLAEWWAQQEERIGSVFRKDRPNYRTMLAQPDLFKDAVTDDLIECFCTD